ncbi:MFS transporter [Actinomyces denticolens]
MSPSPTTQAPAPPPSPRALLTTRLGRLAMAMLVVELLAGMQTYINQTVLPLLATELDARDSYGLVTAAAQVPAFLTMPLGGAMLERWRAGALMTVLTALLAAGAVIGALAPTIWVYILGEVLRGLAAGALATVSMGVLVAGLPDAWRRLYAAVGSAMWVISSLIGPAYAAALSAAAGWRWALVGYLPVLVAARAAMAHEAAGLRVRGDDGAPWAPALAMAGGVGVIGAARAASPWFWPMAGLGMVLVVGACARVFPAGSLRLARGRRAAVGTLAWLCSLYFAIDLAVAPAAHDVLGLGPGAIGWALTTAGVCWSVIAMRCGARPARDPRLLRRRTALAGAAFASGGALMIVALAGAAPWWCLHAGFGVLGAGMGLTNQDAWLRVITEPEADDGISQARAATSAAVASSAGAAALATLVTAGIAPTTAGVEARLLVPVLVVLVVGLTATPLLARRMD